MDSAGHLNEPNDLDDLDDLESDLRSTAEDIAADAGRLQTIEIEKTTLEAGDPRLVALSHLGERVGARIARQTRAETTLAEAAHEAAHEAAAS